MKKTLAMQLRDRFETIEYRKVRSDLFKKANDKEASQQLFVFYMKPETIIKLQNEGFAVEKNTKLGFGQYLITWDLPKEQRLAEQIRWKVDFNEKHISVPEKELTEAENNAFVIEMRGLGFYLQSAIA